MTDILTKMKKPILFVDCDDTIENFCEVWIKELNKKYNKNYSTEDIKEWDIQKYYPNTTKEELLEVATSAKFWDKVKPKRDAIVYLYLLQREFDVYIVTSGSYRSMYYKVPKIIKKYFNFIPEQNIICCTDKHLLKGDYLIDDNPSNLLSGYPSYKGILFTAPHNKHINCKQSGLFRADNWKDIYQYLTKVDNVKSV